MLYKGKMQKLLHPPSFPVKMYIPEMQGEAKLTGSCISPKQQDDIVALCGDLEKEDIQSLLSVLPTSSRQQA